MTEAAMHRVKRTAVFLSAMFALTTLAHLGRDMWLAKQFGTGRSMEAFDLVFVLPNLLARFFGGGMGTALVPRATALLAEGQTATRAFWELLRGVLLRLGPFLFLLVVLVVVFSQRVLGILAWGSTGETVAIAERLLTLLFPSLLLTFPVGLALAACHSMQEFRVPSVAGLVAPLVFLGTLMLWADRIGIDAAGWGFFAGQFVALLILSGYLFARSRGTVESAPLDDGASTETARAIGLVLAAWMCGVANVQVDLSMASTQGLGSVPILRYGYRLVELPSNLFMSTIGVVLLPTLSHAIANSDAALLQRSLRFACRVVAALLLPAAAGLMLLAPDLVALLFERGAFDAADTARTAQALRAYAPAVVANGYLNIVLATLHAHRKQKSAAVVGVVMVGTNFALNAILMRSYGTVGIAASTSLVTLINVGLVATLVPALRELLRSRALGLSLLRSLLGVGAMCLALWAIRSVLSPGASLWIVLAQIGLGAAVHIAVLGLLRGGELSEIRRAFQRRDDGGG